jgi:hypothetical protein
MAIRRPFLQTAGRDAIREILVEMWDPLTSAVPEAEHEGLFRDIARKLEDGAREDAIYVHLSMLRSAKSLPHNPSVDRVVAQRIVERWNALKQAKP